MREINSIAIHCADTPASMDIGAEDIKQWHVERGWSDIGYHFVIKRDGTVQLGRSMETPGAHVKGHNKDSLGVCLVGGKDGFNFTKVQMYSLGELVDRLRRYYPGARVLGHRDYPDVTKTCPNFDVKEWFREV